VPKVNFLGQRTVSKVRALQTVRQTEELTDATENIAMPHSRVVKYL